MTERVLANGEAAIVYHIAEPDAWAADGPYYRPAAFELEGFVHFSTRQQVLATAQRYYAGRADLVLLTLDVSALEKVVVYENLLGGEQLFPHYYAEIPRRAVLKHTALALDSNGNFKFPALDK